MRRSHVAVCCIVAVLIGCGGGNKIFQQRDGEVIRGELVLDSIPRAPAMEEYAIGYGDQLDILFLYNTDYSMHSIMVRPDGKIAFPLVGEVTVAGMTVAQLDDLVTEAFSEIIIEPEVSVIVSRFQERLVYVLGEVGTPGGYNIDEAPSVVTALSKARGISDDAKRNGVLVMRRVSPDHVVGIQVDLTQLFDKHRFDLDIPLQPNDIVYVPTSAIKKATDFVDVLSTLIGRPMELYLRGWQVWNIKTYYEYWKRQAGGTPQ